VQAGGEGRGDLWCETLAYFRGISQNPYHGVDKAILGKKQHIIKKYYIGVIYIWVLI
jgi:hypothetical protein